MQENAPLVSMASMSKLGQKDRSGSGKLAMANGQADVETGGQVAALGLLRVACGGVPGNHLGPSA